MVTRKIYPILLFILALGFMADPAVADYGREVIRYDDEAGRMFIVTFEEDIGPLSDAEYERLTTEAIESHLEGLDTPRRHALEIDEALLLDVDSNDMVEDIALTTAIAGFNVPTFLLEEAWDGEDFDIALNAVPTLGDGVIGLADITTYVANGTRYPIFLIERLEEGDLNEGAPDIRISYPFMGIDFDFTEDEETEEGHYKFGKLMAHELSHGLGFLSAGRIEDGRASFGNYATIYDEFLYFGETRLIDIDDEEDLLDAFTSEEVVFVIEDQEIEIFSPPEWNPGSSLSHTNDPDGLMYYMGFAGDSFSWRADDEFWVIMEAIGWELIEVNDPPEWNLPELVEGREDEVISFELSASDPEDEMEFSFTSEDLPDGWVVEMGENDGVFTWDSPSFDDAGEYTLVCSVSAGEHTVIQNVTILVHNQNQAPEFGEVSDQETNENQEVGFFVTFSDPDDNTLDLEVNNQPEGFEFVQVTNTSWACAWTPPFNIASQDNPEVELEVHFQVTDEPSNGPDEALVDQMTVVIMVSNVNRAPYWDQIDDQYIVEDQSFVLVLSERSHDDDLDSLTYWYSGQLPHGASVHGDTLEWIPEYDQSGEYAVILRVDDGLESDFQEFIVYVDNTNRPPEMVEIENQEILEEETLELTLEAQDLDENNMFYWARGLPDGATLDEETREFFWTPSFEQGNEIYEIIFGVTDDDEETPLSDSVVVEVSVGNVNRAPDEFNLLDPTDGSEVRIDLENTFDWEKSNDVDGDEISYTFLLEIEYEEAEVDTILSWNALEDSEFSISLDALLLELGIYTLEQNNDKVHTVWWATASDGEIETESSERRTLILPVPLDVNEFGNDLPISYSLDQNYPNPFNPSTTIGYALPEKTIVLVKVYNMMGQEVAELVNMTQNAGYHQVVWNGSSVSSGMYFLVMKTEGFTKTLRMTLTK